MGPTTRFSLPGPAAFERALAIINRHCPQGSRVHDTLVRHGRLVAAKALQAAQTVMDRAPDLQFIAEAAMLHDIGMIWTHVPKLGCRGAHPYICHGLLGRVILAQHGLERHGLVCERHIGVGLTAEDIRRQGLPLPLRDMYPVSLEEEIICYADKFYSKNGGQNSRAKTLTQIYRELARFGPDKVNRFEQWAKRFEPLH